MNNKIKIRKIKPTITYCGSLVQQNHGEALKPHGYSYWDVQSRKFVHIEIPNDFGYYTLYVDKGVIPVVTDMPKKPRLRVRVSNTDPSEVSRIITRIKTMYNVQEVTLTRMDALRDPKNRNVDRLNIGDISDPLLQNSLIREHLDSKFVIQNSMYDKIDTLNIELNNELDESDIPYNIVWVPKKFEFENMFSYGKENVLDFSSMKDLIGIFAANRSGKSAIADAFSFCLFDKSSRAFKAIDIMNTARDSFKCKFNFVIDDVEYFIERRANRVRYKNTVRVDVDFWSIDLKTGDKVILNGEHRRDTNDIIRQYVGNYEDFILTTLSLQGKDSLFIDKSQSERKTLMSQFIGTSIFDRLYVIALERWKDISSHIKKLNREHLTDDVVSIERNIEILQKEYNNRKFDYDEFISEKIQLGEDQLELTKQLVDIDSSIVNIVSLKNELSNKLEHIENKKEKILDMNNQREDIRQEVRQIKNSLMPLLSSNIESKYIIYETLQKELQGIKSEGDLLDSERNHKEDRLSQLESLEYDPNCIFCSTNAELFSKDSFDLRNELIECVSMINELTENLSSIEIELEDNDVRNEYQALINLKESMYDKELTLLRLDSKITTLDSEMSKMYTGLELIKTNIDKYYESESIINRNKDLQLDIFELRETIDNLEHLIETTNQELMNTHGEISSYNTKLFEVNKKVREIDDLEDQHEMYGYYLQAVKRDGIPYDLISKTIPIIEGEINNILQQVVEFGVVLSMDGKNIDAHIVYGDKFWTLEMCSGMERFISGLAIRTALINICNLPRSTFLIIDEGLGTLDSDNLGSIHLLFDYLKTQFEFLILISHKEESRDMVDDLIEIKNINGFSQVRY